MGEGYLKNLWKWSQRNNFTAIWNNDTGISYLNIYYASKWPSLQWILQASNKIQLLQNDLLQCALLCTCIYKINSKEKQNKNCVSMFTLNKIKIHGL